MESIDNLNRLIETPVDTGTFIISLLLCTVIPVFGQFAIDRYDRPNFELSNTIPSLIFLLAGVLSFFFVFKVTHEAIFSLLAYEVVTYGGAYLYFRSYSKQTDR